jgi:hypothetical protein
MESIDTSQTFMKLLKTSFLLAAAAATQLDATEFRLEYSGASFGNNARAIAIVGIDVPNIAQGFSSPVPAWITSFSMTVTDAGAANGTYGITDINRVYLWGTGSVDYTQEVMGQPGINFYFTLWNSDNDIFFASGPRSITFDRLNVNRRTDLISFAPNGPSGVVDFADWMSSVNNQNRVYAAGTTLASLPLEGAHHRPMMSFDRMGKDAQFWATGDFGSSSRVRDVKVTSGEVGVNKDIGPNTLAGIAIGRGQQNQDLALDGSNNVIGNYVLGEIDYRPFGSQWIVSLLGMVGSWDAKINRGYSNGGSTDYSLGETDITSRSARLRVDAPVLFSVGGFGFSPYASYAVTQTVVEAYTEAGGGLPASYDQQEHNATEARLGVMATKIFNEKLKLIVSLEGIHRFDGAGPALTGQDITGAVGFSLPGQAPRPDCVRLGFDVDYKLAADTLLNVSAHASTVGEVADVSGAVSIRRAF